MKYLILLLLSCFSLSTAQTQSTFHIDKRLPCLNKTFVVYAHAVLDENGNTYADEDVIAAVLTATNALFAPICVKFELCTLTFIDNYNYAEFELGDPTFNEMKRRNHQANRINFYFVNDIMEDVGGFAPLGGIANPSNAFVTLASLGALNHELGHLFGLPHPFAGSDELVDGSNCETAGDGICDTPADPFVEGDDTSEYVNDDCEFISLKQDANGNFYQPLVGNIMSYYPCSCGSFTFDQYMKMAETYLNSNPKLW